jgi:hypothetical protein
MMREWGVLIMKRGVLQNTGPCLQAHYSSLGPARGLTLMKIENPLMYYYLTA